ncbi:hypothetical protein NP233_g12437 [Leucocoprinus birnbaumii]|uniref:AVL9/DENND6 domain-containing protein n=1 Tax=Leucocoprinus birnbaumii TaxID=56174 RepID=A0AAD5VEF3_9AGAR|nr:hypothetical protein NP233_g12437 [Leucocoprinus birnbaumii]
MSASPLPTATCQHVTSQVGPRIEWSKGEIFDDEEVAKILPFLALPDGAHLIAAKSLLVKDPDVTRSTVQKAVVVLASKPVFGPIRDKLRVVTTALFHQRDFSDTSILDDFAVNLEPSLRGQLTESGLYMGTSLREFVHTFRHRTLILVKALILQKRIMFFGHPVERLCTYQYSLISLLPGLLQTLEDCGSPPLANRAPTLSRPNSLKTSDHKSMMAFMGLPLDVFGKDAFFQPYLPLQQLDMIKDTPSWLCGSTNSIVTQQKDIDLLVDTEAGTIEFRDPKLERSAGLTAADRKWMDDIVHDVNESWDDADPTKNASLQFKGSDDYLRQKACTFIKTRRVYADVNGSSSKSEGSGVLITGGTGGDVANADDFNPLWISDFKNTNAYAVWNRITDPLIFDIIEPRHPCTERPSVVADLGLRLSEGIQELKLEQQLALAREAVARTLATGSTSFFKAVEGVRERWRQPSAQGSLPSGASDASGLSTPIEVSKSDATDAPLPTTPATTTTESPKFVPRHLSLLSSFTGGVGAGASGGAEHTRRPSAASTTSLVNGTGTGASTSSVSATAQATAAAAANNLSAWGSGIGSFFSARLARAKSSDSGVPQVAQPPPPPPPSKQQQQQQRTSSSRLCWCQRRMRYRRCLAGAGAGLGQSESEEFVLPEPVDLDLKRSLEGSRGSVVKGVKEEREVKGEEKHKEEKRNDSVHHDEDEEDEEHAYSGVAL